MLMPSLKTNANGRPLMLTVIVMPMPSLNADANGCPLMPTLIMMPMPSLNANAMMPMLFLMPMPFPIVLLMPKIHSLMMYISILIVCLLLTLLAIY